MTKEALDAVEAILIEPLQSLCTLLQVGELSGYQAGELLALVVAGARAELAGQIEA